MLTVKASEIVTGRDYGSLMTLRFPRAKAIKSRESRDDMPGMNHMDAMDLASELGWILP